MADLEQVVAKFEADVSGFVAGMRRAQGESDKSTKQIGSKWAKLGDQFLAVGGVLAGAFAIGKLKGMARDFVGAADEMLQGQVRLRAAVEAAGGEVETEVGQLNDLAAAIQRLTVVSDDEVISLGARVRAMGLSEQASANAAKNAIALARSQGISAESAIRMTSALEQGSTAMLVRRIPALRAIKDETERAAKAEELLDRMFATATAEAQNGLGPLRQLKNEYNDLEEQLGTILIDGFAPLIQGARRIVAALKEVSPESKKVAVALGAMAVGVPAVVVVLGGLVAIVPAVVAGLKLLWVASVATATGVAGAMASLVMALLSVPVTIAAVVAGVVVAAAVFRRTIAGMFSGLGAVIERQFTNEISRPLLLGINKMIADANSVASDLGIDLGLEGFEVPPEVAESGATFADIWKKAKEDAAADVAEFKSDLADVGKTVSDAIPGPVKEIGRVFMAGFSAASGAIDDTTLSIEEMIAAMSDEGGLGQAADKAVEKVKEQFAELRKQFGTPLGNFRERIAELDRLEVKLRAAGVSGAEFNATFSRARAEAAKQYGADVDDALGGIVARYREIQEATRTPIEQFNFDLSELDTLKARLEAASESFDGAEFDAVFARARKQVGGLNDEFERLQAETRTTEEALQFDLTSLDELKTKLMAAGYAGAELDEIVTRAQKKIRDDASETKDAVRDLGLTFTSAFEDAVVNGNKFRDVLAGIEKDLIRLALRKLVTEPALDALGSINWAGLVGGILGGALGGGAGAGAGGSLTPVGTSPTGTIAAKGEAFDRGRVIPFAAGGAIVDRPTEFPMAGGKRGLMGEAGPEAILPLERGPGGKLGVRAVGADGRGAVLPLDRVAGGKLGVRVVGMVEREDRDRPGVRGPRGARPEAPAATRVERMLTDRATSSRDTTTERTFEREREPRTAFARGGVVGRAKGAVSRMVERLRPDRERSTDRTTERDTSERVERQTRSERLLTERLTDRSSDRDRSTSKLVERLAERDRNTSDRSSDSTSRLVERLTDRKSDRTTTDRVAQPQTPDRARAFAQGGAMERGGAQPEARTPAARTTRFARGGAVERSGHTADRVPSQAPARVVAFANGGVVHSSRTTVIGARAPSGAVSRSIVVPFALGGAVERERGIDSSDRPGDRATPQLFARGGAVERWRVVQAPIPYEQGAAFDQGRSVPRGTSGDPPPATGAVVVPFSLGGVTVASPERSRAAGAKPPIPHARGGIVTRPTLFPMARGATGLMGEAGPEAVMPLRRGPDGALGVRTIGGDGAPTLPLGRGPDGNLGVRVTGDRPDPARPEARATAPRPQPFATGGVVERSSVTERTFERGPIVPFVKGGVIERSNQIVSRIVERLGVARSVGKGQRDELTRTIAEKIQPDSARVSEGRSTTNLVQPPLDRVSPAQADRRRIVAPQSLDRPINLPINRPIKINVAAPSGSERAVSAATAAPATDHRRIAAASPMSRPEAAPSPLARALPRPVAASGAIVARGTEMPVQSVAGGSRQARAQGAGAAGSQRVEVNVFAPPGSQVQSSRKQKGPDMEELNIMVDAAVGQLMERPGSKTHRALRRTFGGEVRTTAR